MATCSSFAAWHSLLVIKATVSPSPDSPNCALPIHLDHRYDALHSFVYRLLTTSLLHHWTAALALLVALTASGPKHVNAAEDFAFFENKVRPILVANCYECHSEESGKHKGGLFLDRRAGWQTGGDSGPAIVPGDTDQSLLLSAVHYRDENLQMPPKSRLDQADIEILKQWIAMHAPDPRDDVIAGSVRRNAIDYEKERQTWAYRAHSSPIPAKLTDTAWPRDPVDHFILAQLEQQKLAPAADATPTALLRRLYYDLTGLPPSAEAVATFISDPSQVALEQVVDDLLARPAFGEKWGRHWLDVARYSDSNGGDRNFTFFHAWRYRNYVIDSFNNDRPFYEFVRQQLAGDLLPADNDRQRHDQLIASTFLALGPKMLTERDKEKLRLDTADEQVDTVGRAFLGLTLGCARCHDHKFDPISQQDYYAMAGIFRSTQVVMGTRNGCVNVASWVEQVLPGSSPELAEKVEKLELAMRLVVEKSFMRQVGAGMSLDKLPLAGVIIDDDKAERIGEWAESTYSKNHFGSGYSHDNNQTKGEKSIIFRASLPENGRYEVRVAYNASDDRAAAVPITVEARDGIHHLSLDQTRRPEIGGLFQSIGQFDFEKGGRVNVIIETTDSDGYVIADAVQFIGVDDIERESKALASIADQDSGDTLFQMSEGDLKKKLNIWLEELRDAELAMAPRDAKDAGDIHLRVRGDVAQLGPLVPRNFLRILHDDTTPEIADGSSGRLQLADWMISADNALLDRVMVNRIWHHLFGRGIVASVDNFGKLGTSPTHPDLLNSLASDFRASGGSIKQLIRRLALSRAYRLSADSTPELTEADPTNQLFGYQQRRRLSAEEVRDSVLHLAGKLDSTPGTNTAAEYGGVDLDKAMSFEQDRRRTVYLPIARNNLVAELEVFDAANPDLVSGRRATTTVPTQALYLLNSDFFLQQSAQIGKFAHTAAANKATQVVWLYQRILNRPATPEELSMAIDFIGESRAPEPLGHLAHLLLISTEFLFLD